MPECLISKYISPMTCVHNWRLFSHSVSFVPTKPVFRRLLANISRCVGQIKLKHTPQMKGI